jgi:hypothetical protein
LENKRRGILDSLFASVIGFDGVPTQQFRDKRKKAISERDSPP